MTNKVCRIKPYLLYNTIPPGTYISVEWIRGEVKANNTMVKNNDEYKYHLLTYHE